MGSYYNSCRTLTLALLIFAATCLYVSSTYFEQSLALKKARTDFAWWIVFTHFDDARQDYVAYKNNVAGRKKIFFYAHYETLGHCFIKENGNRLDVQVSNHDFKLNAIEPSFYAPVDDTPSWKVDLDLRRYEPTELTDLTLKLLQFAAGQQGGSIDQDKILQLRLGQEILKRAKQLRGGAQFFGEETKDSDDAPSLYRKIQKDFDKQTVKIPTLELNFFALEGAWILAIITAGVGIMLRNQVSYLSADSISETSEPWIVFDANSIISRAMALTWLVLLSCAPAVTSMTLFYMSFSSAWMNGFIENIFMYTALGLLILLISAISCQQIWTAAYVLNRVRREYWINRTTYPGESLGDPTL